MRLPDAKTIFVKSCNCAATVYIGDSVVIRDLTSATDYNGRRGCVTDFHAPSQRFTIELDEDTTLQVKFENLVKDIRGPEFSLAG